MTANLLDKGFHAIAMLNRFSPMIRNSILDEREFREDYGLNTEAVVTLGDTALTVQRSLLFRAVRNALSGNSDSSVIDRDGCLWNVSVESGVDNEKTVVIFNDKRRLVFQEFTVLTPDRDLRLQVLENSASKANLPETDKEHWRSILDARELDHEEVDIFLGDFRDTPVNLTKSIASGVARGELSTSLLAPRSRKYYERLIGPYDGSDSIKNYAANVGRRLFECLLSWHPSDGFLLALLLSSHSHLTAEIPVEILSDEVLSKALEFLETNGDRVSQLGAIEIGLRALPDRPWIEDSLVRLTKIIRDDDIKAPTSEFRLLSSLFILVDSELSRTHSLSNTPPFYRRLAALSQAALIQRQISGTTLETKTLCDWAFEFGAKQFYYQSLVDLRLEPRWSPDFSSPFHMKADFLGRLMIAAAVYKNNIPDGELSCLLLGKEAGSLESQNDDVTPYLPGPIQGAEPNPNDLPTELARAVEAQLNTDIVGPNSFTALVNSALIFRLESDKANLAANVLKTGSYHLTNVETKSQLLAIFRGLATVAAVSRSCALADELRILIRKYRRDPKFSLSAEEAMNVCLVASASRSELDDWQKYVGNWITELAFEEIKESEGKALFSHLHCILIAEPKLWITCAKADAALRAYLDSRSKSN